MGSRNVDCFLRLRPRNVMEPSQNTPKKPQNITCFWPPKKKKLATIRLLVTSVKDHVCECTRLGLGLLSTSRTYLPQVGGAKLSISNTSPALKDDGLTDGGLEPS